MLQLKPYMKVIIFSVFLNPSNLAEAKPVSYKGSLGIMSENSSNENRFMINYSPSFRLAFAANFLRDGVHEFYIPSINGLLSRWNFEESQANLYLTLGPAYQNIGTKFRSMKFGELQADWENRDFYIEYTNMLIKGYSNQTASHDAYTHSDLDNKKLRLGLSPFRGEFSELNIWYIAQLESKTNSRSLNKTQLMRFFYRNVLWEIGADLNGGYNFNYMINL